ncbi:hypothetical protein WHR41_03368 [Cladosporium halotolerans]|uniref:Aminoglycoside phosphotransferase domain-containing protein n=1 Tax=Cladosporium halotolerans TaxID=1052096 RepID=A0AB34KWK7_9PEZI
MWEPVALPFENYDIPPLPSAADIRECTDVLKERSTAKVVAVNDNIIVKYGGGVRAWEGQALIYLEREVPDVPAPRLYAMYYESKQLFLVMQRVPGVQLESVWSSLTNFEKASITTRLQSVFQAMRTAECPWPNFIGSLDGSGVHHYLFYDQKGSGSHLGPFTSEAAFAEGLVSNFRALIEENHRPDYKARFYEKHLPEMLRGHRSTLTHGDVQRRNILVTESDSGADDQGNRSFDIALVDWEMAGWLPDWWEFFSASSLFDMISWDEDWCWLTEEFLQVRAPEVALMLMFDKDAR